jgi:hypothetical protein
VTVATFRRSQDPSPPFAKDATGMTEERTGQATPLRRPGTIFRLLPGISGIVPLRWPGLAAEDGDIKSPLQTEGTDKSPYGRRLSAAARTNERIPLCLA